MMVYGKVEEDKLNEEIDEVARNLKDSCELFLDCNDCDMYLMCRLSLHTKLLPCDATIDEIKKDIREVFDDK